MATKEYFPGIGKIKFEGKESKNPMAFRYYDADKVIMGKKMSEWLKFAMAWWHTLCAEGGDQFGGGTKKFPWNGEADKVQAIEMAPALAVQKMIESGLTPEMVVQYKTVDQLTGIAEASAQMFEHVHLGQVTVYGNENTAGNFMAKTAENLNPAFDLLRSIPFADTLKSVLGKKELEEKKAETTEFEEVK